MKNSNKLLITFIFVFVGITLYIVISPISKIISDPGIKLIDEGKVISVKKKLPNFTKVHVLGIYKINITQGKENSITITSERNLIPQIKYEVVNRKLMVYARSDMEFGADGKSVKIEKFAQLKHIEINIITKRLTEINCNGICNFIADDIKAKNFYINFNGASTLYINGKIKNLNIESNGFDRIYADELQAKNVKVELNGASRVTVWATDKLSVDMKGWNYLNYKGKPKNIIPVIKGYGKITESKSGKPVKNWFGLWIDDNITIDRDKK